MLTVVPLPKECAGSMPHAVKEGAGPIRRYELGWTTCRLISLFSQIKFPLYISQTSTREHYEVTHLPALALFNLLLISSATAVESPLSSGSPGMKDWPENAMAVPAMHTVARISFIMIKYLNE